MMIKQYNPYRISLFFQFFPCLSTNFPDKPIVVDTFRRRRSWIVLANVFWCLNRALAEASPLGRALQTAVIAYGPILAKATHRFWCDANQTMSWQCHATMPYMPYFQAIVSWINYWQPLLFAALPPVQEEQSFSETSFGIVQFLPDFRQVLNSWQSLIVHSSSCAFFPLSFACFDSSELWRGFGPSEGAANSEDHTVTQPVKSCQLNDMPSGYD